MPSPTQHVLPARHFTLAAKHPCFVWFQYMSIPGRFRRPAADVVGVCCWRSNDGVQHIDKKEHEFCFGVVSNECNRSELRPWALCRRSTWGLSATLSFVDPRKFSIMSKTLSMLKCKKSCRCVLAVCMQVAMRLMQLSASMQGGRLTKCVVETLCQCFCPLLFTNVANTELHAALAFLLRQTRC